MIKTIIHNIPFGFYLGGGERLLKGWNDNIKKGTNNYLIYEKRKENITTFKLNSFKILEHNDFEGLNFVLKSTQPNVIVEHGIGWVWNLNKVIYSNVKSKIVHYFHNEVLFRYAELAGIENVKRNVKHIISNYNDRFLENSGIEHIVSPLQLDITKYPFYKRKHNLDNIKVGIVGRISEEKIPVNFIKELKVFAKENKNYTFYFLGAGLDHLNYLKKEIRNNKNIIYQGFCRPHEIKKYYKGYDVLLSPSLSESGGYAILEAMATGLPAITRGTGALPETVFYGGITGSDNSNKELFNNLSTVCRNVTSIENYSMFAREKILEFNSDIKKQFKQLNKFILL